MCTVDESLPPILLFDSAVPPATKVASPQLQKLLAAALHLQQGSVQLPTVGPAAEALKGVPPGLQQPVLAMQTLTHARRLLKPFIEVRL